MRSNPRSGSLMVYSIVSPGLSPAAPTSLMIAEDFCVAIDFSVRLWSWVVTLLTTVMLASRLSMGSQFPMAMASSLTV